MFVLATIMSGCSTTHPNQVNHNYLVKQSDKIYQEDVVGKGSVMSGTTGESVTDTAEFYRNKFYQCAIKYNGLIDRILKGNSNG